VPLVQSQYAGANVRNDETGMSVEWCIHGEKADSSSKKIVTLLYSIPKYQKPVYRQCAIGIYWQIMRKLIIRIQSDEDKTKKIIKNGFIKFE